MGKYVAMNTWYIQRIKIPFNVTNRISYKNDQIDVAMDWNEKVFARSVKLIST